MKAVLKSAAFGIVGAALCYLFFSVLAVPLLGAWSRLHNPNTPLAAYDVVIEPMRFLRLVGLPLAGAAFVACFTLGWKKFAHPQPSEHRP